MTLLVFSFLYLLNLLPLFVLRDHPIYLLPILFFLMVSHLFVSPLLLFHLFLFFLSLVLVLFFLCSNFPTSSTLYSLYSAFSSSCSFSSSFRPFSSSSVPTFLLLHILPSLPSVIFLQLSLLSLPTFFIFPLHFTSFFVFAYSSLSFVYSHFRFSCLFCLSLPTFFVLILSVRVEFLCFMIRDHLYFLKLFVF